MITTVFSYTQKTQHLFEQYFYRPIATAFFIFSLFLLMASQASANIQKPRDSEESLRLFKQATALLEQATSSERQSAQKIVQANKIRKDINRLRAKARRTQGRKQQDDLRHQADHKATQLRETQQEGGSLRQKSKDILENAMHTFEQAMVTKWGQRIRNRLPMAMDDSTTMFIAHNTRFRSVHPDMLNQMGTPTEALSPEQVNQEMSILVPALAEQNAPPDLNISSFQLSRQQQFLVHIEVQDNNEEDKAALVPHNTIHKWHLMLSDLAGEPIKGAQIEVEGHMPGHVHGLPTQPQVTQEVAPGVYQVEGVKFQMKGWWVMKFHIAHPETNTDNRDSVVFNLVL